MKIIRLIIFLVFATCTISYAQNQTERLQSQQLDAEYYFFNGDYEKALKLYKEILLEDPENCSINYKIGLCYQRMPFEAGRSISYLKKAVKEVTSDYIEGSVSERRAPIVAWYALARAYHTNKFYEEGVAAYQQYIDRLSPNELQTRKRAMRELISCRTAAELLRNPVPVEIFNIGNVLNTEFNDFNPCPTADGKFLFFTRMEIVKIVYKNGMSGGVEKRLRIYMSKFMGGERWSAPRDITDDLHTSDKCSILSINSDGTYMLVCKYEELSEVEDLQKGGVLYYSTRTDKQSKWSTIKKFGKNINIPNKQISQAAISDDGKTLFVSSNKDGGFGGFDLWKSELKGNEWSELENLGQVINTEYDESSPYILKDGKTLYFTSVGHYNMGGFDAFKSTMNENGTWLEPENLGSPINTPNDNSFYKPAMDGKYGFYSVAYNEGYFSFGGFDIYQVEYVKPLLLQPVKLTGTVSFADKTTDFSNVRIQIRKGVSNEVLKEFTVSDSGSYSTRLSEGTYVLEYSCPKYIRVKKEIKVERSTDVKKEMTINVKFNSDTMLEELLLELDEIK